MGQPVYGVQKRHAGSGVNQMATSKGQQQSASIKGQCFQTAACYLPATIYCLPVGNCRLLTSHCSQTLDHSGLQAVGKF
jgi:hypothetical protein